MSTTTKSRLSEVRAQILRNVASMERVRGAGVQPLPRGLTGPTALAGTVR